MRAGSYALSIFARSLSARTLRAHEAGPLRLSELEERIGWAPQSSLRAAIASMRDFGALRKLDADGRSQTARTELTPAGRELLPVADTLEHWLQEAPDGPISLEDAAALGIVRVLTAGWDSTIVRALAERPLTLSELSDGIPYLSYPALKRRLAKLRSTRLVVPVGTGKIAAYAASDWLRRAVVPLAVAGRWELLHEVEAEPISRIEVEAAFLLTLPLVELPRKTSGACTLAAMISDDGPETEPAVASIAVEMENGSVVSCSSTGTSGPTTWALGTVEAWLAATIEGCSDALRVSGANPRLAQNIVKGLHDTLFQS